VAMRPYVKLLWPLVVSITTLLRFTCRMVVV